MNESVIFIDLENFKRLPELSTLSRYCLGRKVLYASEWSAAMELIDNTENVRVLISNAPKLELFKKFVEKNPKSRTILITDLPLSVYSPEFGYCEEKYLNHIIASRFPSDWSSKELRVTLWKIIEGDLFGIAKYLKPFTETVSINLKHTSELESYSRKLADYVRSQRLGVHLAKQTYSITEELLMNAMFDAPLKAREGKYKEDVLQREVAFPPEDQGVLSFACDESTFAIGVCDPFGTLPKTHFFNYLRKVIRRSEDIETLIDRKQVGAGLGLYKIFYHSHALICNSELGKRTEMIALIDLHFKVKDFNKFAKSVHFFSNE